MQRLISIIKINKLKKEFRRPLIKSSTGQMLPDFRTRNKAGFDVTSNYKYLKEDSDIPNLLHCINKYCPTALVHGVYSMGTRIDIIFGDIQLHIELENNKIIRTTVQKALGSMSDSSINIEFKGNDIKKVFKNSIVNNHVEYSILHRALVKQYCI